MDPTNKFDGKRIAVWLIAALLVIFAVIAASIGGCAGIKAFNRSQARANAHNAVAITNIQIENQAKYAQVIKAENASVQAKAEQRLIEARGIRAAQDEISKTLTPFYLQHEAIEAEKAVATSGNNNTVVYVPSGQNGVPVVTARAGEGK